MDYWWILVIVVVVAAIVMGLLLREKADGVAEPVAAPAEPVAVAPPVAEPIPGPVAAEPAMPVVEPVAPAPTSTPAPPAAIVTDTDKPKIAAATGEANDLSLIKGVGPKLNALLISLGVIRFDQIAAWGDADIAEVDRYLGNFRGRVVRDDWIDQARYLARGDKAGFEAKYGALEKEIR